MQPKFESNFIICSCGDLRHQLVFSTFEFVTSTGKTEKDCYLQVFLNKHNFLTRLLIGIKYILGFQSKFGVFEEFVIDEKNANKIKNCMESFLTKPE